MTLGRLHEQPHDVLRTDLAAALAARRARADVQRGVRAHVDVDGDHLKEQRQGTSLLVLGRRARDRPVSSRPISRASSTSSWARRRQQDLARLARGVVPSSNQQQSVGGAPHAVAQRGRRMKGDLGLPDLLVAKISYPATPTRSATTCGRRALAPIDRREARRARPTAHDRAAGGNVDLRVVANDVSVRPGARGDWAQHVEAVHSRWTREGEGWDRWLDNHVGETARIGLGRVYARVSDVGMKRVVPPRRLPRERSHARHARLGSPTRRRRTALRRASCPEPRPPRAPSGQVGWGSVEWHGEFDQHH